MVLQELPQDTVRLIKSTQVITTPVSLVKELLENSIDAGATSVTIRLEKYGFGLVEVRDNGSGIEEEDVKFIAKPHFTSKIESFADLASLNTYGFRGEALASLCAVAEVSITTKTKDGVMGHTYTFDHAGTVTSKKPAAAPNGTSIMARNLFKNLPVRKQYYSSSKRQKEELKKVEDLVLAFTLAAPVVHLTLSHDKLTVIQKSSVKNIQEALMSTFPAVYKDLVLRKKNIEDIHIETYLPCLGPNENPSLSRTTADRFFVLVNQRPVVHKSIEKVVKAFYSQKVQGSHGRYPLGVVTLSVPPASVDVNLEPNKNKILLRNENQVLETVQEILSELYGPLEQHPKKSNDDITCTFGDLIKDSEMLEEENIYNSENIETEDCFLDINNKRGALVCNGKTGMAHTKQAPVGSVDRGKAISGTMSDSEKCGSALKKDIFRKPFQVKQVEKEQKNTSFISNKTVTSSAQLTLNYRNALEESCHGKDNAVCASTPKDSNDACFPSISETSIASDDDDFEDFLSEKDLNVIKGFEKEISGIAPLPLSCITEVCGSGCVKENNAPVEQNCKDALPKSNSDEDKLHESFTGSDGIPVYKIPPLPPFEGTINKHVNDKSKVSLEDISPLHSDLENIQDGKPRDPEEREGSIGGAWSRGMPVDGKNIQTVQLVSTATLGSKLVAAQDAARRAKRHVPVEPGGVSATPPKKTKINSLAPANYDHTQGTPMKKPSSPFILFARDIRRQVLCEHPGADFAFVAKEMADRWKTLDTDSKNHYKELAKAEADRYHMQVKQIKESRARSGGSPLARGCNTAGSLDKYIAPLTPYIKGKGKVIQQEPFVGDRPWLQHRKEIKCSLDTLKEKINKRTYAKNTKNTSDTLTVLGQVTSIGGWLCVQGSDIVALNVYRVYEVVLYNNLLKTFRLSMKPLDTSIPFNASTVGVENWAALLKLPRELVPDRNFYWVTDQRLIANGFHVALFPGATASVTISHGEVTQMADTIKFYGITDLKEILSLLAASPLASLQQTRPLKLQHWIKEEAVRLVRSAPNIVRREDVLEKVKSLHLLRNGNEEVKQLPINLKCIHGRPLCTKLHSLEDLPSREQKHTKIPNKVI
uniref:HMG box domain-containing protein n=1 Tax=Scylla olivacea TaxID=85551 RepID=A0A0P4W468_SCYOL